MKRWSPLPLILLVASCAQREPEPTSRPSPPGAAAPAPPAPPAASAAPADSAAPAPTNTAFPKTQRAGESTFDVEAAVRELQLADKQLGDAVSLAAPDCVTARTLRDRICELATRLCLLASPTPDLDLRAKCIDGKTRCEAARQKVDDRCP